MTKYGFSLIELLVVITIIGVLSTSALSAYSSFSSNTKLNNLIPIAEALIQQTRIFSDENGYMPQGPQDVGYANATALGHAFTGSHGGTYTYCVAGDPVTQPSVDAICVQDVSGVYSWPIAARIDIIANVAALGITVNSVTVGSGKTAQTTNYNDIKLSYYVYQQSAQNVFSNICFFGNVDPIIFGGTGNSYDSSFYDNYLPQGCAIGGEPV